MLKKTALIIGGDKDRVLGINYLKRKGYKILLIDSDNANECIGNVDFFIQIEDFNEFDKVYEKIKKFNITFILPVPLGKSLELRSYLSDKLQIEDISLETITKFTDKIKFENLLDKLNIQKSTSQRISKSNSLSELKFLIKKSMESGIINYPIIVKPIKGSGSRNVLVLKDIQDVNNLNVDFTEEYMVSKLVLGSEFGLDILVKDYMAEIILIREKKITKLPYRQELGFTIRQNLGYDVLKKITTDFNKIIYDTSIKDALFHVDILIEDDDYFFIEASPRPAGLGITDVIWNECFEQNPYTQFINYLIGEQKEINLNKNLKCQKNFKFFLGDAKIIDGKGLKNKKMKKIILKRGLKSVKKFNEN